MGVTATSRWSRAGTAIRRRSRRGARGLGRVGQQAQGASARDAALEVVQDIGPGRLLAVERRDSNADLAIQALVGALPLVERRFVGSRHVVQRDEDLGLGVLDQGRQRPVPALAAERDPPARQPAGAAQAASAGSAEPSGGDPGCSRTPRTARRRLSPAGAHGQGRRLRGPFPRHDGRMRCVTRVVIVGGGPGGYEAALVGSQLGGEVTLIDTDGLGGSAVLTDCVPSKTLIATAEVMTEVHESAELGLRFGRRPARAVRGRCPCRPCGGEPARCWSSPRTSPPTSWTGSQRENVQIIIGRGRLDGPDRVVAETADGRAQP